jgi:hypothetical protein
MLTYVSIFFRTPFTTGTGSTFGTGGGGEYVCVPGVITGVYVVADGRGGAVCGVPPFIKASKGVLSIFMLLVEITLKVPTRL